MLNSMKISIVIAGAALVMGGCASKVDPKTGLTYNHHCTTFITTGKCTDTKPVMVAKPAVDGDDDKDGVLNSADICSDTPAGVTVDANGCRVVVKAPKVKAPAPVVDGDDDKDGVLNSMDKCPTTSANVLKVDSDGCAVAVDLKVQFEFDSFSVTDGSMANIKAFGMFMNEHKSYKANIEGHTDSSGQKLYNQILSQKRAEAVAKLISSEGNVDASRLIAIGKGQSTPVADNATREGRKANRRTEAHIVK